MKRRTIAKYAGALLSFFLLGILSNAPAYSQCDTNQHVDSNQALFDFQGTMLDNAGPIYWFEMHYDSCRTMYSIGEFKRNSEKLPLANWCYRNVIRSADPATLGDTSRTEPFYVVTGDTISYYRELYWLHDADGFNLNSYHALDTLDYVVELVDDSTGLRLTTLDSIGLQRETGKGTGLFYGTGNSAAIVQYITPSLYNQKTVFLRLKLYARGTGLYNMIRFDRMSAGLSARLNNANSQSHILTP